MPTFEYVFCNENVECTFWKHLSDCIGDSPSRAWYWNIVTDSVFCRSEVSSRKFHLWWIFFKTADPFFSKFGTIVDQPRAQKIVKRHFWKIIPGDFYSKKIVKSGKFVPFFDRLRIFFIFSQIYIEMESLRSQSSQLKYSPSTFFTYIFHSKKIAFE